jgi:hypothetical protein
MHNAGTGYLQFEAHTTKTFKIMRSSDPIRRRRTGPSEPDSEISARRSFPGKPALMIDALICRRHADRFCEIESKHSCCRA